MSSVLTRRFIAAAMTATLALGLAACSSSGSAGDPKPSDSTNSQAASGGNLVFTIAGGNLENGHMDPHASQLDSSATVNRNIYDSLVALDADGTLKPWLATKWEVSEDGKTYTFTLREDVTFHDGTPFNAAAAVANFEHIKAPETASAQALGMLGGELFDSAEATSEFTLVLHLTNPYAPLLNNLSTPFIGMYSPKVLESRTQDEIKAGGPEVSIGSGPFVLTEYSPKQQLVFTPNKDYTWGPDIATEDGGNLSAGPNKLDSFTIRIVPEESARIGALQSGQAHVSVDLTPTGLAQLQGAELHEHSNPGMPFSAFINWEHGVFKDLAVRQAFQAGLNIDAAVNAAFGGSYKRAWSILTPTTANAYDASLENAWPYNEAKANELLDSAGWTQRDAEGYRTKDGQRLSAEWLSWLPFSDEKQALVNFLVDDMKKIGFEVKHSAIEGPDYQARYADANGKMILDFDITDWGFASLDADILRQHLHSEGYQNASALKIDEIDGLLDEASTSTDPERRAKLYSDLQMWNNEQVAIVPLFQSTLTVASLPDVTGLAYNSYGWPLFAGAGIN